MHLSCCNTILLLVHTHTHTHTHTPLYPLAARNHVAFHSSSKTAVTVEPMINPCHHVAATHYVYGRPDVSYVALTPFHLKMSKSSPYNIHRLTWRIIHTINAQRTPWVASAVCGLHQCHGRRYVLPIWTPRELRC